MKKTKKSRKILGVAMIVLVITAVIFTTVILTSSVFGAVSAAYTITNDWGSGAIGNVKITNSNSTKMNGWTVSWNYTNGQTIASLWGGDYKQSGSKVTVTNPSWGQTINANSSASVGFIVSYSGSNPDPINLTVNGGNASTDNDVRTPSPTSTSTPVSTATKSPSKTETPVTSNNSNDPKWSTSDQWGLLNTDGYTIYNNIWGGGAGSQTVWANSYKNWGVNANHPNTGGIKSYPNCERQVNKKISQLNSCKSSFDSKVPSGGSYATAYDIWCNQYTYEIMLWMNWNGKVGPIAGSYDSNGAVADFKNVNVGGHTWNVYKGSNGSNEVFSFLRTSETNSGTVDVKAICNWIKNKGWFGDVTLYKVQLGWEITSSSGGLDFIMNDYSVSYN